MYVCIIGMCLIMYLLQVPTHFAFCKYVHVFAKIKKETGINHHRPSVFPGGGVRFAVKNVQHTLHRCGVLHKRDVLYSLLNSRDDLF